MTRVLITGISGFIGGHLREHLSDGGLQVYGYDLQPFGEKVFVGDILDEMTLFHALEESSPDVVIHLAGVIKSNNSEMYYRSNLFGTLHLLDAIIRTEKRPRVIIASSSAVYGLIKDPHPITERSNLHPMTEYGISKVAQEMAALRYHYTSGLPVTIVRMFNLLGPGQSPNLACSAFAYQIARAEQNAQTEIVTGNLDAKRDFVDVRDAVHAFKLIAEKGGAGQAYNVCSGRAVTIQSCLDVMMSLAHKRVSVRMDMSRVQQDDVPVQVGSFQKLYKSTGWHPEISLKQSLSDLLDDWRERVKVELK